MGGIGEALGKPKAPGVIATPAPPSLTNPNTIATPNLNDPSSVAAPTIPDYMQPTQQAQDLNMQAMMSAFGLNATNQNNPYGSLTYSVDPTTGQYTANQNYNPTTQNILNAQQGAQQGAGNAASNLYNSNNFAGGAPNLGDMASGLTSQQLDAYTKYNKPYYDQAYQDLDNQLRNQGLIPGMQSYDYQIKKLRDQQSNQQSAAAAQFEPQAFSQANTQANLPADLGAKYLAGASPGNIQQNLWDTPTAQANPANLAAIFGSTIGAETGMYGSQLGANSSMNSVLSQLFGTEVGGQNALNSATMAGYGSQVGGISNQNQANMSKYNAELQNWGNTLKGIAGIGAAPFTGGASLGTIGGIFNGPTQYSGSQGGWNTNVTPTNALGQSSLNPANWFK